MLSEFLSANTPTPFLLKMVESFFVPEGEAPSSDTEAKVGLWTGNLVSVFFITQFFTSLLWSGVAGRYGRRAVLVVCMAVSSSLLGQSTGIRLIQVSIASGKCSEWVASGRTGGDIAHPSLLSAVMLFGTSRSVRRQDSRRAEHG